MRYAKIAVSAAVLIAACAAWSDGDQRPGAYKGNIKLDLGGYLLKRAGYNENLFAFGCSYFLSDQVALGPVITYTTADNGYYGSNGAFSFGPFAYLYLLKPTDTASMNPYVFGGWQRVWIHQGGFGDSNASEAVFGIGTDIWIGQGTEKFGQAIFVELASTKDSSSPDPTVSLRFGLRVFVR